MGHQRDPYSRLDYRRLIAWPRRIEREAPFLSQVFGQTGGVRDTPRRRLLDLGCGTGEHSYFLSEQGFDVTGVDRSAAQLSQARDRPLHEGLRFVEGDLSELASLIDGHFDGALCLGNTLPHLRSVDELSCFFAGLRQHLSQGAPFLLQILAYDKIFEQGLRHLPLNFRGPENADPNGEEIIFLRLMTPRDDGTLLFNPTTLRYRPGADPPLEVVASKNVELRGWRRGELVEQLHRAGFGDLETYGGMQYEPFDPATSSDLVLVARA